MVQRRSLYSVVQIPKSKYYAPSVISCSRSPTIATRLTAQKLGSCSPTSFVSQARPYSSSDAVEDEERKGLFYHPLDGDIYALSFLSEKPPSRNSATVIGLIPEGQGLEGFEENRKSAGMAFSERHLMKTPYPEAFIDLLHDTVKSALTDNVDPDLANDATQRQEGWMHVHDKICVIFQSRDELAIRTIS
ncbi:hypothetical protein FRC06_011468 [Ceratobasidium sp. 370]|nr:hypothetical protein FRC06_011468 [Ceratobasidium sp. 370]